MALIIGIPEKGDFYVGEQRFVLEEILSSSSFRIRLEDGGKEFHITDRRAQEVFPEVFVSAGSKSSSGFAKIVIDAPLSIRILRGEVYRLRKAEHERNGN